MVQRKRQRAQQTSRKSAPVAASAKSRMFGSKTARAKVQYSKHRSKQRSKQRVPTKFVVSGGWRSDDRLFALRSDEAQARRAWRGYPRQVHVGTGNEEASHQALAAVHALTFTCGRPGCGALVDYIAAKQQVALGQSLRSGAGCAGALCSSDFRRAQFVRSQHRRASQLLLGEKLLVRRPGSVQQKRLWAVGSAETSQVAHTVLSRTADRKRKGHDEPHAEAKRQRQREAASASQDG
jgi:hypothetical protein